MGPLRASASLVSQSEFEVEVVEGETGVGCALPGVRTAVGLGQAEMPKGLDLGAAGLG